MNIAFQENQYKLILSLGLTGWTLKMIKSGLGRSNSFYNYPKQQYILLAFFFNIEVMSYITLCFFVVGSSWKIPGQKHTYPPVWKGIVSPVKTYCSTYIPNYIPSMKRINTQGYYQQETTPEYVFLTLRTNHSWECIWLQ